MAQHEIDRAESQSATILIVEDDLSIQHLLSDLLKTAGYTPFVTGSASDALRFLENESVDLVLLDLMLPDMDGTDVCRRIRASEHAATPIIMLTAISRRQNVVEGLQSGADDYVTKPFYPQELLLRIRSVLRTRQESLKLVDENGALHRMLDLMQRDLQTARRASETEALLRQELLHNVTTHLQSLSAIVDAELRRLPPGMERESVQRLRGRIRGAVLVYQVSDALQSDPVDIGQVINLTASALKSIYRPWKRITVNVSSDKVLLPPAIASSLAMIVNELVTNCFKHAFPDNRFGTIDLAYRCIDNQFTLEVVDNGTGFGDVPGNGNGRATVQQLMQHLNGTVSWDSTAAGTTVSVQVPIDQPSPQP